MSDYNILIAVRNKVPIQTSGMRYLVCDNADYTLTLDLDEDWAAFATKTVLFVLPGGAGTVSVLTEGNECRIPVIRKPGTLRIGVTAGEELRTSRELEIVVKRSIRTLADDEAEQVPPDMTQQIIGRLDKLEQSGGGGSSKDAVLYIPQELTHEEQSQARENITAARTYTLQKGETIDDAPEDADIIWDPERDGEGVDDLPTIIKSETGDIVSVSPIEGTDISVVSHIDQAAWNNGNRLYLRQMNGGSVIDVAGIVRAALGKSWTAYGLTCTVNDDDTLTVRGTVETENSWVYALNCECGSYIRLLPAGTYTIPQTNATIFYGAFKPITDSVTSLGNKSGTFTIDEPFYIRQIQIIYYKGQVIDETIPLTMMMGETIPETGFAYTAKEYAAQFANITTSGTYSWQTGELRDTAGKLVQTLTPAEPFVVMEGTNTFFTGAGKSSVRYSAPKDLTATSDLMQSISVEYGRTLNTGYQLARIPRTTNGGRTVRPVVRLTSADGTLGGEKCSALTYARREKTAFVLNAGLFDVAALVPLGQTIIDGVSVVNEKHPQGANGETISDTECYPLCIDGAGMLSAPYANDADTADMIADGIVQACTGWVTMVDDYEIAADEIASEIVHSGKYIQNIIGQFDNGDYCVLSTSQAGYENNPAPRDEGLTKTEAAQILVDRGVRFAYALDGGGSAETVLGERQINPIYEGTAGRRIPAVIVFETV